jgi:hypothetical protein
MDAHVREIESTYEHGGTHGLPAVVGPPEGPTCEVCLRPIKTSKPARCCSARCRAEASRWRRQQADRARLDEAEAALRAALRLVEELRADLARRAA